GAAPAVPADARTADRIRPGAQCEAATTVGTTGFSCGRLGCGAPVCPAGGAYGAAEAGPGRVRSAYRRGPVPPPGPGKCRWGGHDRDAPRPGTRPGDRGVRPHRTGTGQPETGAAPA